MKKIIKQVMVLLLSFILCFQNSIILTQAAVDTDGPEVDETTLEVENNNATVGDVVKVSIKAEDETGVESVNLVYEMPISGKVEWVYLKYNNETDRYEGSYEVTEKSVSGK